MKTASLKELKTELEARSNKELIELCLSLSKFKKENKELLTYLLYESENEDAFIKGVKEEIDVEFQEMNKTKLFFMKKTVRKVLRLVKKYIRYSKKKETEIELLLHFCTKLKDLKPSVFGDISMVNLFQKQKELVTKATSYLHEDLQYDYSMELEKL
jgi:hypothetical protein